MTRGETFILSVAMETLFVTPICYSRLRIAGGRWGNFDKACTFVLAYLSMLGGVAALYVGINGKW